MIEFLFGLFLGSTLGALALAMLNARSYDKGYADASRVAKLRINDLYGKNARAADLGFDAGYAAAVRDAAETEPDPRLGDVEPTMQGSGYAYGLDIDIQVPLR